MDPSLAAWTATRPSMFWSRQAGFTNWVSENLMVEHHSTTSSYTYCYTQIIYPFPVQSRAFRRWAAPRITLSASAKPKFMGSSTLASVNLIMPQGSDTDRQLTQNQDDFLSIGSHWKWSSSWPSVESQIWGLVLNPCHIRNLPSHFK